MQKRINNMLAAAVVLCGLMMLAGWMIESSSEIMVDVPVVTVQ